jgi:hypothetical protein
VVGRIMPSLDLSFATETIEGIPLFVHGYQVMTDLQLLVRFASRLIRS